MAGFDGHRGALHQLRRPARTTQRLDPNEHGGRHGHRHGPLPVRVAAGEQIGIDVAVPAETLHQAATLPEVQILRGGLRSPTEPPGEIASTEERWKIAQTLEGGDLGPGSRSHGDEPAGSAGDCASIFRMARTPSSNEVAADRTIDWTATPVRGQEEGSQRFKSSAIGPTEASSSSRRAWAFISQAAAVSPG